MNEFKNTIEEVDNSVNPILQIKAQNIIGMFQTVSVAPTGVPFNWQNQIQIYTNGGTLRLYWYDVTNNTWHYITATA